MTGFWIALLCVFAGGVAIGLQPPVNAALARTLDDSIVATAISFAVGFIALFALIAVRNAFPSLTLVREIKPWMLLGGLLGAFYVWTSLWGVSRLGVVTLIAAIIIGQMFAAILIDRAGAFGLPVHEISWQRVVAVILVGAGLVMSRL
ncbi:DMT family transporter [Oricola indica]|jgi:transporter family-2 protein|uniref:DMT family transporter n=1 Tax=Oricola indica TaxID=2872591 RepID=UPI003CCBB362